MRNEILIFTLLLASGFMGWNDEVRAQQDPNWVAGGFFDRKKINSDFSKSRYNDAAEAEGEEWSNNSQEEDAARNKPSSKADNPEIKARSKDFFGSSVEVAPLPGGDLVAGSMPKIEDDDIQQNEKNLSREERRLLREMKRDPQVSAKIQESRQSVNKANEEMKRLKRQPYKEVRAEYIDEIKKKSGLSDSSFFQSRDNEGSSEASIVSLVVSAEPVDDLLRSTDALLDLYSTRGIRIGEVLVVGDTSVQASKLTEENMQAAPPLESVILEKTKLGTVDSIDGKEVLQKYQLTSSPSWIITYKGTDFILEGSNQIGSKFTRDGGLNVEQAKDIQPAANASGAEFTLQTSKNPVVRLEPMGRGHIFRAVHKGRDRLLQYLPDIAK